MLYYLFEYLENQYQLPYFTFWVFIFRAACTIILSLLISTIYGKRIIKFLNKHQLGESVRDLGLDGQKERQGHQLWADL